MKIKNYNIEIDGRNFYDQSITWLSNTMKSKKYQQGKVMITQQVAYWICLFEKNYRLITVDLSKQKALDADSRAVQQIIFTGQADDEALKVFYILEKIKRNDVRICKRNNKSFVININGWIQ